MTEPARSRLSKLYHLLWMHTSNGALLPGIVLCLTLVFAAHHISDQYGSPLILTAVLLGMAFNSLSRQAEFSLGLDFCTKILLRFGVALLGVRVTFEHVNVLGMAPLITVVTAVVSTLAFSLVVGQVLKMDRYMALLIGIGVSICGVSAAMATLAFIPEKKISNTHVLGILIGITGISTMAFILYPLLIVQVGLSPEQTGLFLGASIHDVAQAVGAGQMISAEVADTTIYTKMLRVSLLVPILFFLALFSSTESSKSRSWFEKVPLFLLGFITIVVVSNLDLFSETVRDSLATISQFCLLMAMASLGTKTNLVESFKICKKSLALILLNTVFLAGLSFTLISILFH